MSGNPWWRKTSLDCLPLLEKAKGKIKFVLPSDHVAAEKMDAQAKSKIVKNGEIPADWVCLDIGPETVETFSEEIRSAKTVVWNGPMGVFEMEPFSHGTFSIAKAIAGSIRLQHCRRRGFRGRRKQGRGSGSHRPHFLRRRGLPRIFGREEIAGD